MFKMCRCIDVPTPEHVVTKIQCRKISGSKQCLTIPDRLLSPTARTIAKCEFFSDF